METKGWTADRQKGVEHRGRTSLCYQPGTESLEINPQELPLAQECVTPSNPQFLLFMWAESYYSAEETVLQMSQSKTKQDWGTQVELGNHE